MSDESSRGYMPPSQRIDWETPPDFFAGLDAEFGFTLDVCAHADNAKCERFLSLAEDGLLQPWEGETCWMNPPYGRIIRDWCAKAHREAHLGATVVGLLPSRTDTAWFHDHILGHAEVRFIRGRLRFVGAAASAPFPSIVVVWRPEPAARGAQGA